MANSTRTWALRELNLSHNNIDWAGTHLSRVAETYQAEHPEVAEPLIMVCQLLIEAQNLILKVRGTF